MTRHVQRHLWLAAILAASFQNSPALTQASELRALPTFAVDARAEEMQFWVTLLKDFGVTKGTATAQQVIFQ